MKRKYVEVEEDGKKIKTTNGVHTKHPAGILISF